MKQARLILLVEPSVHTAEFVLMALSEQNASTAVVVVNDGAQALDYLSARGEFQKRGNGMPAVVLLDLRIPKVDGLEVLRQIKADRQLRTIPVVMLSSSLEASDLLKCYELGANACVVKPVDFQHFKATIKQIGLFWTTHNEPPPSISQAVGAISLDTAAAA